MDLSTKREEVKELKDLQLNLEVEELEEKIAPAIFSFGSFLLGVSSADATIFNTNRALASNSGILFGAVVAINIPVNLALALSIDL
jgi:hypothetical protein